MGYEKCMVFMIPTNGKSTIALVRHAGQDYESLLLYDNEDMSLTKDKTTVMHHLYVTSDEITKEGDWVTDGRSVYKASNSTFYWVKKIIATTDKSLTVQINNPQKASNRIFKPLPQLPLIFIERYAEAFNNKKQIITILVEYIYEETEELSYCFINHPVVDEDNQIKIKLIKDSWSWKELPIDEMKNLVGFIDTPIGRRKYPEEVISSIKKLAKWIENN